MRKFFYKNYLFTVHFLKYIFIFTWVLLQSKFEGAFVKEVFLLLRKSSYILALATIIAIIIIYNFNNYYCFIDSDFSILTQDIMDYKDGYSHDHSDHPNFHCAQVFDYHHYPSYFLKNEFLTTNFTFKYLNYNVQQNVCSETENFFLLKQSYIMSDIKKLNYDNIKLLNNCLKA